ncbi:InlB B-repeat-containing protein [Erysipelothrix aquatica]|uniref:InlB B-repeat-containing protein n=2 Tax=Erysipelothrix aquatica TaxID=2683714 RepID=UPI001358FFC9|nr:InlB B-repeat-containing protein [Erysipelothrix aquatica]
MKKKLKIFMVLSLVLISVPFLNINADESNTNQEVSTPITETAIDNDTTGEVCADNNDDSPCDELPETEQENESEDVIDDVTDGETELDPGTSQEADTDGLSEIQTSEDKSENVVQEVSTPEKETKAVNFDAVANVDELMEAIATVTEGQVIKLAPDFVSGPMTVTIPNVSFVIDGNGVIWNGGNIKLQGNQPSTVTIKNLNIDGQSRSGYLFDDSRTGGSLEFYNASVYNAGSAVIYLGVSSKLDSMHIYNNKSMNSASAIKVWEYADLTLTNSTIENNHGSGYGYEAGAISAKNYRAKMVIENTVFRNNINTTKNTGVLGGSGGAITINDLFGSVEIRQSIFEENKALGDASSPTKAADDGGALYVRVYNGNGTVTIDSTSFIRNEAADDGGAILFEASNKGKLSTSISNSTFLGNVAHGTSGGDRSGGAIQYYRGGLKSSSTNVIKTSTFIGNQSGDALSTVNQQGGAIGLSQSSILSPNASFDANIFAGNTVYGADGLENTSSKYKDVSNSTNVDLGSKNVMNLENDPNIDDSLFEVLGVTTPQTAVNESQVRAGINHEVVPTIMIRPGSVADNTYQGQADLGDIGQRGLPRDKDHGSIQVASILYDANGGTFGLDPLGEYDGTEFYLSNDEGIINEYYQVGYLHKVVPVQNSEDLKLSREGYTFGGWSRVQTTDGSRSQTLTEVELKSATQRVYAIWIPDAVTYTVTYHGNGETQGVVPTDTHDYLENDTVTVLGKDTLEKTGYTFTGWNTQADGKGTSYNAGSSLDITENTDLYAQWELTPVVEKYTVTYHGNGETSGVSPVDANEYLASDSVTVLGRNTLEKTGYTFTGWNTQADGKGTSYNVGSSFDITENTDLYAQWELTPVVEKYTVTYHGNGETSGVSPVDAKEYLANDAVTILGRNTLEKTGYTFVGWNTQADGKGTQYTVGSSFDITENTDLHAQWELTPVVEKYTVTYHGNGETSGVSPVDPHEYKVNDTVTILGRNTLEKTGHKFLGWNTQADGKGTQYSIGSSFEITENTELYAQWEKVTTIEETDELPKTGIQDSKIGYIFVAVGVGSLLFAAKIRKEKKKI